MRGVAAVTPLLDDVAPLTEGGSNFLRDGKVFPLNSHSFKPDRMAALPKLCQFFLVALPAFLRKDHGFLFGCELVVDMAGHAMDPFLGMFRFNPGLKNSRGHLLMAVHTESRIHFWNHDLGAEKRACDKQWDKNPER
jgi:hypothetical protein